MNTSLFEGRRRQPNFLLTKPIENQHLSRNKMETPQNVPAAKEFQVTGVSRSGRVRKKSSKLLDFQSPDEVEKKLKRTPKSVRSGIRARPSSASGRRRVYDVATIDGDLNEDMGADGEIDRFADANAMGVDLPTGDSDEDLKELVAGIVEGEPMEGAGASESKVRQSLYMTEKANKRKILRDGKIVTGKLERKDKGKSRYTAYSMWARELRKTSKFSKNQDLDFSNTARRLGELWANVSNKEKSAWRRKAKIQATKAKAREKAATTGTMISGTSYVSFIKATTSRTKKLATDRQKTTVPAAIPNSKIPKNAGATPAVATATATVIKRKRYSSYNRTTNSSTIESSIGAVNNKTTNSTSDISSVGITSNVNFSHKKFSTPNIEPIDAAAHLKLLGESLTIIGERLKEHEGQIAVSGSLSVLLDSLLCSLGPLLCLTRHIPGLEKKPQLSENLAATLDNIAYVMPGL